MNIFRRKKNTRYYFVSYSYVTKHGNGSGHHVIEINSIDGDVFFNIRQVREYLAEQLKEPDASCIILHYKELSKYEYDKNIEEGKDTGVRG